MTHIDQMMERTLRLRNYFNLRYTKKDIIPMPDKVVEEAIDLLDEILDFLETDKETNMYYGDE